jgi:hypothetical protein
MYSGKIRKGLQLQIWRLSSSNLFNVKIKKTALSKDKAAIYIVSV